MLQRRRIPVSRAILIGLALPLGQLTAVDRTALNVPTYTAAAFANKALASDLQGDLATTLRKAEAWAVDRYAPALARRDRLSESDRRDLAAELARFTGFSAALIDPKTLDHPDAAVQRTTAERSQAHGRPLRQPADGSVRCRRK